MQWWLHSSLSTYSYISNVVSKYELVTNSGAGVLSPSECQSWLYDIYRRDILTCPVNVTHTTKDCAKVYSEDNDMSPIL